MLTRAAPVLLLGCAGAVRGAVPQAHVPPGLWAPVGWARVCFSCWAVTVGAWGRGPHSPHSIQVSGSHYIRWLGVGGSGMSTVGVVPA